jgi:hypothetical protein
MLKLLLLGAALALTPQNTGVLQGTVERGDVSEPIGGVEIRLTLAGTDTRLRAISDPQGRFFFENLPAGRYTIQAVREGYFTYPQARELPAMVASLTIDSPAIQRIEIKLVPGAVIAGRITDPQGQPLPGVRVSVMKLQYADGQPAFTAGSVPKATDDRGEYRLSWFPPGEYYIRAEYPGGLGNLARRFYYPGTLDSALAVPLTVRGGESLEGMNFAAPPASSIRISGQIAFEGLGPASGTIRSFYLLPQDGRPAEAVPLEFRNTVAAQADRALLPGFSLDLHGVAPGLYDLAPFYLDTSNANRTGRTRVEIADQDVENLTVVISPNVEVRGRFITKDGNTQHNWSGLHLQLRAKDTTIPLMGRSNLAAIAPDGTFTIRDVSEGLYQVYLTASSRSVSPDLYISGMRQGALDIRNEGSVDVRASMLPLEITLSTGAGSIRGIVEAPAGGPPAHADVVLVPAFSRRSNLMFYDRTISDEKGQFTFTGIAPGEYKVFAFEQLADTAEQNPTFIARYETLGLTVTVNPGTTTDIRSRLLR